MFKHQTGSSKHTLHQDYNYHGVLGGKTGPAIYHSYLVSTDTPVNLLGRDMLIKLRATILCGSDGLQVHLPNGTQLFCGNNTSFSHGQYLLQPLQDSVADIYWVLLQPETTAHRGILSAFHRWKS
ncbi:hypothetical protein GOODEAATRI_034338 [Goodea atripinnis]|uniref:Peptidase A2 domain-containing protein n=1 Tax=Goodea atripinnis TaxID=208336 RepID=A0ABV0NJE8_9TELE